MGYSLWQLVVRDSGTLSMLKALTERLSCKYLGNILFPQWKMGNCWTMYTLKPYTGYQEKLPVFSEVTSRGRYVPAIPLNSEGDDTKSNMEIKRNKICHRCSSLLVSELFTKIFLFDSAYLYSNLCNRNIICRPLRRRMLIIIDISIKCILCNHT